MYKERIWVEPHGRLPTVGLGRSLGRPHPQRQQIPEIDNVDDSAARRLPCPRRAASILEEGSPRRLPAYYQNTETSTSLTKFRQTSTRSIIQCFEAFQTIFSETITRVNLCSCGI